MKFVRTSGELLIATRLRQLSSLFWEERQKLYDEQNIKFKPNWGIVVMLIQGNPGYTINDIAAELGFAHTSVLKIVKDMANEGYLTSTPDKNDGRRKILSLTKKGIDEHKRNTKLKECIEEVNRDLLQGSGLLEAISIVESKFEEASFYKRIKEKIEN